MKISIFGLGYVGLANAILLSAHKENEVLAFDINEKIVNSLQNKQSHLEDKEIIDYLQNKDLNLSFTNNFNEVASFGELILIATPTNYDDKTNQFDTSSIENVISQVLQINKNVLFLIKSTIPVGFVQQIKAKFQTENIIFSPEFLREGRALFDNLYPSRIIVGEISQRAEKIANLFKDCALNNPQILLTNSNEAESIKLFANTYLALRVAFFNELDTFASAHNLDAKQIIEGISLDPRIGKSYNNPSFGFGGYCLPKDTKQLKANYQNVPENIISAIIESNKTRKEFIVNEVLNRKPKVVGIYRLIMKANSDNFRDSAIFDIIKKLRNENIDIIIFEPNLQDASFESMQIINDFNQFTQKVDVIIANRFDENLKTVQDKVYTRDVYGDN